jgi:signal transduction histidine kinase
MQDGRGQFVPPTHARAVVDRGIAGWVIKHQRGDLIDDLSLDPRWLPLPKFPFGADRGSVLLLPLLLHNRVVSILALRSQEPGFFNSEHLQTLQQMADQTALSIENARLYEAVRHRAAEMAALYEVALNISADQPLARLLDTVVAQAMDLLRCQGGGVFLWRENEAALELVAAYDPEIDLRGLRIKPGDGLVGQVFEIGDPLAVDEYGTRPDSVVSSGLPTSAAIAVPLVWQGRPLGVLVGTDRTPGRYFGHRDQHLLTVLANQAAAAIASVQMHEQTSRRLKELNFLNETIQAITVTLDLDEIFAILTKRIKDLLGIEACSIALLDRETDELVFLVASGGGAETVVGERVPSGHGIVGAAALSGRSVNVSDVSRDGRFYQEIDKKQAEFTTQSILAVPMISRGRVVGVMEGLNKPGGFDSEDQRLLSALASLAASVVENANLISAQRELERLRESLTHMIVHDLRSPVGTVSNCLQLLPKLVRETETEQAQQLIEIASRATQRLLNMVDSILDIGRLEAGQELTDRRPLSVKSLVRSATDQMALYAQRKRMLLNVDLPDRLPLVLADGGMIERVLVNLITNAIKFTPANGEVNVSVKVEPEFLHISVRDNGPGIAPEHQRRIFDKFARVRDQDGIGGIGLGLAFCRLAIEAHGGQIWVESSPGSGSIFTFTLPRFDAERGST